MAVAVHAAQLETETESSWGGYGGQQSYGNTNSYGGYGGASKSSSYS